MDIDIECILSVRQLRVASNASKFRFLKALKPCARPKTCSNLLRHPFVCVMCMKFVYVCDKTDYAFFVSDFAQNHKVNCIETWW